MRFVLASLALLAGCGGLVDPTPPVRAPRIESSFGGTFSCVSQNGGGRPITLCGGANCPACPSLNEPCADYSACADGLVCCNNRCALALDCDRYMLAPEKPTSWMALGQFDDDPSLDLAIESESGGEIRVYSGRGPHGFRAVPRVTKAVAAEPGPIVAVKNPGKRCADLIRIPANTTGAPQRFQCDEQGTFAPETPLAIEGAAVLDEILAPVESRESRVLGLGEGLLFRLDLAAPDKGFRRVLVARSFATSAFDPEGPLWAWDAGFAHRDGPYPIYTRHDAEDAALARATWFRDRPRVLAAGHFHDPALVDLLVQFEGDARASLLHGNAGGGFDQPALPTAIPWPDAQPSRPQRAAVDDFNGDGLLDVACVVDDGALHVWLSTPAGQQPFRDTPISEWREDFHDRGQPATSLIAGDVDEDGSSDIVLNVVPATQPPTIVILHSQTAATSIRPTIPLPLAPMRRVRLMFE